LKIDFPLFRKYYGIAKNAFIKVKDIEDEIRPAEIALEQCKGTPAENEIISRLLIWNHETDLKSMEAVIFCHLALESFINYYAFKYLGKAVFEKRVKRLDFLSKWVFVPLLKLGKNIGPSSREMIELEWLNKKRNLLVHDKPFSSSLDKITNYCLNREADARRAVGCVEKTISFLKSIDPDVIKIWARFAE